MTKKASSRRIYGKPPIVEAVIDLRFDPADGFDIFKLESVAREAFLDKFPKVERQFQSEIQIKIDQSLAPNPVITPTGLRFTSLDGKQILQTRIDGFTFSRLAPYDRWEGFSHDAKRLLEAYLRVAEPKSIVRTALRFINRFDLPGSSVELSEYFNIYPQVPDFYRLNGLTMQVIVPQESLNSTLVISQALGPRLEVNVVSVFLDFDLFNEDIRPVSMNIWEFFDQLHSCKNEIFESTITNKARELIS